MVFRRSIGYQEGIVTDPAAVANAHTIQERWQRLPKSMRYGKSGSDCQYPCDTEDVAAIAKG